MNLKYNIILIILSASLLCPACKQKSDVKLDETRQPVASVGSKVLYRDEILNMIPPAISPQDSLDMMNTYTRRWIEEALIYEKAEQNIIDKESIDELVKDYRENLVVHAYQERLLRQELSQEVPESDLLQFYEENKDQFKLNDNIIKGLYLKIPVNSTELKNFRKWYTDPSDAAIGNIEKKQLQNAVAFDYFYDRWVNLESIMESIPHVMNNEEQFLKTKKNIEVKDSSFVYLLNIKEYKLKGTEAPFEYIKSAILEHYLKKNEATYLRRIRNDLYDKALTNNEVIFYNK